HVRKTTTTSTTQNPVVDKGKAGGDEFVLSTQEYIRKAIDDVDEDEDFKGGSWVSTVEFVDDNGRGIVNGHLGDIENCLKNRKVKQVVLIIKSCTLNALEALTVTLKDLLDDQYKLDEEALNLTLKEEARAEQEWLEKCRQEQELDEERERQLWGFYV
nr:hypothetical protein [Tanacetum cinerariifolium]